mgnify:CR=1 FL=1
MNLIIFVRNYQNYYISEKRVESNGTVSTRWPNPAYWDVVLSVNWEVLEDQQYLQNKAINIKKQVRPFRNSLLLGQKMQLFHLLTFSNVTYMNRRKVINMLFEIEIFWQGLC